jgi:hypothetical protein
MDGFHVLTMKLIPLPGHIVIEVLGTVLQVAVLPGKRETGLIPHLPIKAEYLRFYFTSKAYREHLACREPQS